MLTVSAAILDSGSCKLHTDSASFGKQGQELKLNMDLGFEMDWGSLMWDRRSFRFLVCLVMLGLVLQGSTKLRLLR